MTPYLVTYIDYSGIQKWDHIEWPMKGSSYDLEGLLASVRGRLIKKERLLRVWRLCPNPMCVHSAHENAAEMDALEDATGNTSDAWDQYIAAMRYRFNGLPVGEQERMAARTKDFFNTCEASEPPTASRPLAVFTTAELQAVMSAVIPNVVFTVDAERAVAYRLGKFLGTQGIDFEIKESS